MPRLRTGLPFPTAGVEAGRPGKRRLGGHRPVGHRCVGRSAESSFPAGGAESRFASEQETAIEGSDGTAGAAAREPAAAGACRSASASPAGPDAAGCACGPAG
jgi:hypothetical protein